MPFPRIQNESINGFGIIYEITYYNQPLERMDDDEEKEQSNNFNSLNEIG